MEEKIKLEQLSLSEVETLLEQEMDELVGGDNYYNCYCSGDAPAKSV